MTTTTGPDHAATTEARLPRSSPVGPVQMIAGAVVCLVGALGPWTSVSGTWLSELRAHGLGPGPVKPGATLAVLVVASVALGALGATQLLLDRHSQLVGGAGAMLSLAIGLVWVFRLGPAQYFVQYVPGGQAGTGALAWAFWLVPAGAVVGVIGSLWSVPGREEAPAGAPPAGPASGTAPTTGGAVLHAPPAPGHM